MNARRNENNPEGGDRRSVAEWVTLGISVAMVGMVVGMVVYSAIALVGVRPAFEVRLLPDAAWHEGGMYYMPVTVKNTGGLTAGDVVVTISAPDGPDLSQFTIAYLAGGERAQGVGVLDDSFAETALDAQVTSYIRP